MLKIIAIMAKIATETKMAKKAQDAKKAKKGYFYVYDYV